MLSLARLLWLALLAASTSWATSPQRTLLVVNRNSEVSRQIGEYYQLRRKIPAQNVCRIRAPRTEVVSRRDYRAWIEDPVRGCLLKQGAVERIDYIVTTKGVPLRVSGSDGRRADLAAVDSELTLLYRKIQGEKFETAGHVANPMFRQFRHPFDKERFGIYLVARLTGFNIHDVRAMIDRSLAARNRGRVVLDVASVSNDAGNRRLRSAARLLPPDRRVVNETNDVVYDQSAVIGYASWGSNDPQRQVDGRRDLGMEWFPGAVAVEYVSTDARTFEEPPADWRPGPWNNKARYFKASPQTLTADFIRQGATAASGHVYEPYLDATPFPQYLFPAYLEGRTLAESFYLSIPYLSWMNIIVGDPLCRLN